MLAGAVAAAGAVPIGYIQSRNDAAARIRFAGRLGFAAARADHDIRRVLFHGVSVGEVKLIKPLLAAARAFENAPGIPPFAPLVASTTPAGIAESERLFPNDARAVFPIDFPGCASRFIKKTSPDAVVFMEWEMWPLFLQKTASLRIPACVVNGRISQKTFERYRILPEYAARRLGAISFFAVQHAAHAERLAGLGVEDHKITIAGNMKFDGLPDPSVAPDEETARLLKIDGAPVLIAASTHAPEEAIVARAAARLRARGIQTLRIIIVPRHVDRAQEIETTISPILGPAVRWSLLKSGAQMIQNPLSPILIDTIGDLEKLYRFATAAFIGGSLQNDRGGQNMLEPAALAVPVVHGPSVANFEEAARVLKEAGASTIVGDEDAFVSAVGALLMSPEACRRQGLKGQTALAPHRGAASRTAKLLRETGFL